MNKEDLKNLRVSVNMVEKWIEIGIVKGTIDDIDEGSFNEEYDKLTRYYNGDIIILSKWMDEKTGTRAVISRLIKDYMGEDDMPAEYVYYGKKKMICVTPGAIDKWFNNHQNIYMEYRKRIIGKMNEAKRLQRMIEIAEREVREPWDPLKVIDNNAYESNMKLINKYLISLTGKFTSRFTNNEIVI